MKKNRMIGMIVIGTILLAGLFTFMSNMLISASGPYSFTTAWTYSDTLNDVQYQEVKLTDLDTGNYCIKETDENGEADFDLPDDLTGYADGHILKLEFNEVAVGYQACQMIMTGGTWLNDHTVNMVLYSAVGGGSQTKDCGSMALNDGTISFNLKTPSTIDKDTLNQQINFRVTGSTSYSQQPPGYPNADRVKVWYKLYLYRQINNQWNQVDSDDGGNPVSYSIPTHIDPYRTVSSTNVGTFKVKAEIEYYYVDSNGQELAGSRTSSYRETSAFEIKWVEA